MGIEICLDLCWIHVLGEVALNLCSRGYQRSINGMEVSWNTDKPALVTGRVRFGVSSRDANGLVSIRNLLVSILKSFTKPHLQTGSGSNSKLSKLTL